MEVCPLDITYCSYQGCPIKECERHPAVLKEVRRRNPGAMVSLADFSGSCREYIRWLIEQKSD